MRDKRKELTQAVLAGLFLAWLIFNGILLIQHELWRDEANVWLIARDLNPLQLFKEIRYQGHPCLWYLIVMPFAKIGLPFVTIEVLSFLIMMVTAGVFTWKAPVHIWTKAICLFSPIFTYFYPCVARNYGLIALIVILLAWCYPLRNRKPFIYGLLLGLLVQADTIALAGAGLISLMWLWENCRKSMGEHSLKPVKHILKGIWIPLVSFFLWIAQFYRVSDSPEFQFSVRGFNEFFAEMKNFSYKIVMRLTGQEQTFCLLLILVFLAIALCMSVRLRDGWPFCVMAGSFLFQVVFSVMVYQLHIWHYISLCFFYLWMLWVWAHKKNQREKQDPKTEFILGAAEIWIMVLAISMFVNWNSPNESSSLDNALHGLYSDGKNVAAYMQENVSSAELIVSTDVSRASTVLAYLGDYEFYYAGSGKKASYANYNEEQSQTITLEKLVFWAREQFPEKTELYLLDSENSCLREAEGLKNYEVLYRSRQATAKAEEYTLYRIPIQ